MNIKWDSLKSLKRGEKEKPWIFFYYFILTKYKTKKFFEEKKQSWDKHEKQPDIKYIGEQCDQPVGVARSQAGLVE